MTETIVDRTWRRACAAALSELPEVGPARLYAILADAPPEVAWERIADGAPLPPALRGSATNRDDLRSKWMRHSRTIDPWETLAKYDDAGIGIWTQLDQFPARLLNDPSPAAVLYYRGDPSALNRPTVALVGTRRCTSEGRTIAQRLGRELADSGVSVVSGLALGIDGAAHRGALASADGAPAIGVVGSGLDVIYPRSNADIWRAVGEQGLLISESPLGVSPEQWRFPARNRLIAGLADLVVVVESGESGGSLLTVNEAEGRGKPVMAVPGSIQSKACRGTNFLISDGCAPVCSVDDILMALELDLASRIDDELPSLEALDRSVLEAIGRSPTSTDEVVLRSGIDVGQVCAALVRLEMSGWIEGDGGWWQRIDWE